MTRLQRVAVAVVLAVFSFGSAFPMVKIGLRSFAPGPLALLRFAVASVAVLLYMVLRRVPLAPRQEWRVLLFLACANIVGYHLLFNLGQGTVSASAASVLVNTSPICTAIFAALLLRERPPLRLWAGLLIAFAGAALIAMGERGALRFSTGAIFVVLAAVLQGLSFVIQKPIVTRYGATSVTAASIWIGAAVLAGLFGRETIDTLRHAEAASIAAVIYAGAWSSVVGLVSWAYVMSQIPASRAAPFLFAVPIVATTGGLLLIGELPQGYTIVGGLITLAGVALAQGWLARSVRPLQEVASFTSSALATRWDSPRESRSLDDP